MKKIIIFYTCITGIFIFLIWVSPEDEGIRLKTINYQEKVVCRTLLCGKSKTIKEVLYEDGSDDSFCQGDEYFFLEKGDTVIYSGLKSVEIKFKK